MKKLTFLINSLSSGGAEKVLTTIANYLVEEGYNVEVIFLEKNEFYELDKRVKKTYLSNFTGKEIGFKKLLFIPILAWRLKRYIKKNNIKLIQSHIFRANYVNILAKLFGANHKVQIVNVGQISRYKKERISGIINLLLIKLLYNKTNLIISKSVGMKKDLESFINIKVPHIVINNPYDIKKIEKLSNEKVDEFQFEKLKKYIISVGRLISLKRQKDLIKALTKLPNDIEVIFLGDGEEKQNLIKLSKELGVYKRVHFLGRVKNPYKFMKHSHIFVNCSESEGFPNVLVEAMICGVPVISSDCISGPREILAPNSDINKQLKFNDPIEKGEYGILYPIGNVDRLVEAVMLLENNESLRRSYILKGKKRAEDFSVEKIVEKYKRVLLNE